MNDDSLKGKMVWQLSFGMDSETLLFSSEEEAKLHARKSLVHIAKDEIASLINKRDRLENQIKNLEERVERVETAKNDDEEKALQDIVGFRGFIFLVPIN